MSAEEYISELLEERDTLDPIRYGHAIRMINDEIRRVENTEGRRMPIQAAAPPPPPQREHRPPPAAIVETQPPPQEAYPPYEEEVVKLTEKVLLPITEFPKFNFVGRLIGPGGSIMKGIAEATGSKVAILGKGSMKDKAKEEELCKSDDPKHAHFKEPMHVFIQVEAPKSEAHARVADALDCIQKALLPTAKDEVYDPLADMGFEPQEGYRDRGAPRGGSPPRGGGRGRGRGRGGRTERPPRDEYPPRYDDSGPSRYEERGRGGYRGGDKRGAPAEGGYAPKKFRDDPYADPYAKTDPYAQTSRY